MVCRMVAGLQRLVEWWQVSMPAVAAGLQFCRSVRVVEGLQVWQSGGRSAGLRCQDNSQDKATDIWLSNGQIGSDQELHESLFWRSFYLHYFKPVDRKVLELLPLAVF